MIGTRCELQGFYHSSVVCFDVDSLALFHILLGHPSLSLFLAVLLDFECLHSIEVA